MRSALIFALLAATVSAHIGGGGYVVPQQEVVAAHDVAAVPKEESLGPVIRTGRYRVVQERILGGENDVSSGYQQRPQVQAREEQHFDRPWQQQGREQMPDHGERFHYDGPNDGRRVYIYRRVQTPVRITNGVVERLGPAQTVERWAEGGYKGAQSHNIEVYHRFGQDVYADRVVPVKQGFLAGAEKSL